MVMKFKTKRNKFVKCGTFLLLFTTLWIGFAIMEKMQEHNKGEIHIDRTDSQMKCEQKRNIAFLKVHKTGGSTVTNILQRFGITHHLNFALPNKGLHTLRYNYIGGTGDTISKDNVMKLGTNQVYNILCNHVIYNRTAFKSIFPNDTYYLSIVRNPTDQFISTIKYYGSKYIEEILHINASDPVSIYLKSPTKHEPKNPYFSYTNNRQILDFGLPIEILTNISGVRKYIQSIVSDFNLVMLTNHFEESLILLKRDMCWSFKDIVFIPKNVANSKKVNLSVEDSRLLKHWTKPDRVLYEVFREKFKKRVNMESSDFMEEVLYFKGILRRVKSYCYSVDSVGNLKIKPSAWDSEFEITFIDCLMLKQNELKLLDKLYHDMFGIVSHKG